MSQQPCALITFARFLQETQVILTLLLMVQISVEYSPDRLLIQLGEKVILNGQLYSEIKREDSMWLLEDSILHLTMLKRNRRGNYANQCTNADTYWKSVLRYAPQQERLQLLYPPDKYYTLPFEGCDSSTQAVRRVIHSHAAAKAMLLGQHACEQSQQ